MLVLALDTSTPVMTAGIVRLGDGSALDVLAEQSLVDPFAHAEHLMPLLRQALADAGQRLTAANAVVTGLGPGPFTGLRVGIATAAALGDGLGIPVYGVGSHQAVAAAAGGDDLLIVTDARRREVYVSFFTGGRCVAGPVPMAPAAVPAWLASNELEPVAMAGAGTTLLGTTGLPVRNSTGLSRGLVEVARPDLLAGTEPGPLTPLYLRRPDATEPSAVRKSVLGR